MFLQEGSVVPILLAGMQALVKERPRNPVQFLEEYLINKDPQKKQQLLQPSPVPVAAVAEATQK